MIRLAISAGVIAVACFVPFLNPIGTFFGILSTKFAAYSNPLIHKITPKISDYFKDKEYPPEETDESGTEAVSEGEVNDSEKEAGGPVKEEDNPAKEAGGSESEENNPAKEANGPVKEDNDPESEVSSSVKEDNDPENEAKIPETDKTSMEVTTK